MEWKVPSNNASYTESQPHANLGQTCLAEFFRMALMTTLI